jgi:hypothetical protein
MPRLAHWSCGALWARPWRVYKRAAVSNRLRRPPTLWILTRPQNVLLRRRLEWALTIAPLPVRDRSWDFWNENFQTAIDDNDIIIYSPVMHFHYYFIALVDYVYTNVPFYCLYSCTLNLLKIDFTTTEILYIIQKHSIQVLDV